MTHEFDDPVSGYDHQRECKRISRNLHITIAAGVALLIAAVVLWDATSARRELLKTCNNHRYELRYWVTLPVTARPPLADACLQPDIQGRLNP